MLLTKETFPGSDVFLIGGVSPVTRPGCSDDADTSECSIDILLNPMPEQWESYNTWMIGDTKLDWQGPQAEQVMIALQRIIDILSSKLSVY